MFLTAHLYRKLEESDLVRRMERIEQLITENLQKRNGWSCFQVWANSNTYQSAGQIDKASSRDSLKKPNTNERGRPDAAKPNSSNFANVGRIYCAGYKFGDINMFHGVPFLSREGPKWIGFRTDDTAGPNGKHEAQAPLWQNQLPAWPDATRPGNVANGRNQNLPPREMVDKYLQLYLHSEVSHVFPIADPILFPQILDKAYHGSLADAYDLLPAKSCVESFLVLVKSLLGNTVPEALRPVDSLGGGAAAELLFADIVNARASTEAVGALMIQVSSAPL